MKTKTMLLASAAGVALMPNAQAADLPVKAAAIAPAASWAGWYIGVHAGAAWQQNQTAGTYAGDSFFTPVNNTLTTTGFIGGGQIGYNWQNGNAVYGLEADISGLTGKTFKHQIVGKAGGDDVYTSNKIDWLSTFRGRMGLAVGNAMVYATAGLAVGGVKNSYANYCTTCDVWNDRSTRVGFAVGGGVEHMLNRNWSLRLEGLFVDLGKKSIRANDKTTTFSNQAVIARVGLNYKF